MNVGKLVPVALLALMMGCSSDAPPEEMDVAVVEEEVVVDPDVVAIEGLAVAYMDAYNAGDVAGVASLYTDEAWVMNASGQASDGMEQIVSWIEGELAGSPMVVIETQDIFLSGERAATWGTYAVEAMGPDGAPMEFSGSYMNALENVEGEWKIAALLTNFDSPRPEGWEWGSSMGGDPPAEEGMLGDLVEAYETHWNLGHPDQVAAIYAPDAMAALGNTSPTMGRAAIQAMLTERMGGGDNPPTLDLHDVNTWEMADGYMFDGGWYEFTSPDTGEPMQMGVYFLLVGPGEDGAMQIQWAVSNALPPAPM